MAVALIVTSSCLALACLAEIRASVRLWRGKPNWLERGLRRAFGGNSVRWARSAPIMSVSGFVFFAFAAVVGGIDPLFRRGNTPHPSWVVLAGLLLLVVFIALSVVGIFLGVSIRMLGRPRAFIPPHLRTLDSN